MHKSLNLPENHLNIAQKMTEEPKEVAISSVLDLIAELKQGLKSPELAQLIVITQTKLLHLQMSWIQSVPKAIEVMLRWLGNKPSISLSEITGIFTESATNDEKYGLIA